MHFLQRHFVDQTKKQKTTKIKKKQSYPPPWLGFFVVFFELRFCFLDQENVAQQIPNVAQHLRSMRGYVNPCERRHVLGERMCEFSVEKSY